MASVGDLTVNVLANIDGFMSPLKQCTAAAESFSNTLNQATGSKDVFGTLTKNAQRTVVDMKRIAQGIVFAQLFYKTVNAVQAATEAVWEYTDALNDAEISFSNLFRSSELAEEFVSVLQSYAARSPFDFTDVEEAALQLRAYGIEAENMMYVIEGIGNLASVTGDYSTTFERVSRAIGQINSKGKLMGEEMRQLAEAGLDVNAVYQKLGTSADSVADDNISSARAINAIIEVMQDEYSGALDAANTTVDGMLANIRDVALMVTSGIVQPLYDKVRGTLYGIYTEFEAFQGYFQEGGLGYAIEQYFGTETLTKINQLLNVMQELGLIIIQVAQPALKLFGMYGQAALSVFSSLLTIIAPLLQLMAILVNTFMSTAQGARVLQVMMMALATATLYHKAAVVADMVVQALNKIMEQATLVSKALTAAYGFLSGAVLINATATERAAAAWKIFWATLNKNPLITIISLVLILTAAVLGLSGILDNILGTASSMSQFDASDFLNSIQLSTGDESKFNNSLSDTNDALEDMQDNLEDTGDSAKKAVEGLLSFDEVFSLPEASDSTTSDSALGDYSADLGDYDISMPDTSDWLTDLPTADSLFGDWWQGIVDWWSTLQWPDIAGILMTGFKSGFTVFMEQLSKNTLDVTLGDIIRNSLSSGLHKATISKETIAKSAKTLGKNLLEGLKAGLLAAGLDLVGQFIFDSISDYLRDNGESGAADILDAFSGPVSSGLATLVVTKNPWTAVGAAFVTALFDEIDNSINTGDWSGTIDTVAGSISLMLARFLPTLSEKLPTIFKGAGKSGGVLGVGSLVVSLLFGGISDALDESGDTDGATVAEKAGTIISTAMAGAGIGAAFGPIGIAVGTALGAILGTIMAFWDEVSSWWENDAWPTLIDDCNNIGTVFSGAVTILKGLFEILAGVVTGNGDLIMQGVSDMAEGVTTETEGFAGILSNRFSGIAGIFSWLSSVTDGDLSTFFGSVSSIFSNVSSFLGNLDLSTAGKSIINGLLSGLKSAFENVKTFISGIGTWIVNHKGPESYDKNLLVNAGQLIMGGLNTGLDTGFEDVISNVSGMGSSIASALSVPTVSATVAAVSSVASAGSTTQTVEVANPYLNTDNSDGTSNQPTVYVHTLIANKQALRELKKELNIIETEDSRWG